MRAWAAQTHGLTLEVVYPPWRQLARYAPDLMAAGENETGLRVIPRRRMVERTFSWLGRYRRLSKDDERLPATAEAFVYLSSICLLLDRLSKI